MMSLGILDHQPTADDHETGRRVAFHQPQRVVRVHLADRCREHVLAEQPSSTQPS